MCGRRAHASPQGCDPGAGRALPALAVPRPQVSDEVDVWLPPRVVPLLHRHGIRTLVDLTVRIPRRRRWWLGIAGLGMRSARHIETFFAAHPALTERARSLVAAVTLEPVVPWESIGLVNSESR